MLRSLSCLAVLIMIMTTSTEAQDIHYSQFFNSPLNLNPALAGSFNGDTRVHANFKEQWSSVPVGYTSGDLGFDQRQFTGDKGSYLGYGLLLNYDQAGDLDLGWTGGNAFLSYSLRIGDQAHITPGVSLGYYQRGYDPSQATTGSQWTGKVIDPGATPENLGNDGIGFFDAGAGLNLRKQSDFRKFFDLGASFHHLNMPTQKVSTSQAYTSQRPMKMNFYGMLNQKVANKVDLLLNALYSTQDAYQEVVVNGQGKFYLGSSLDKALYLGVGYRLNDAIYPMIGLQLGQFYGAFNYDLNISDWDIATDGRGGPELSLRYIWSKVPEQNYIPCLIY